MGYEGCLGFGLFRDFECLGMRPDVALGKVVLWRTYKSAKVRPLRGSL